jgi:hypothetical protein
MAANTVPIYSRVADIQWITAMTAANTTLDLTSGTSYLVFTADATNGGFVREVRFKASPANNTAATVLRLWLNNGSTTGTAANSALVCEIGVPATTASNSNALPDFVVTINMALPPGYKLYATMGTAPGGSGQFTATAIGGKY